MPGTLIYHILKPYVMGTKGLLRPDKTALYMYILFVQVFMYGARLRWDKLGGDWVYYYILWLLRNSCCAAAVVILYILRLCIHYIYNIYVHFLRKILFIAAPRRGLSAVYILYLYYILYYTYRLYVEVSAAKSLSRAAQCS